MGCERIEVVPMLGALGAELAVAEDALLVPLRVAWLPPVRDGRDAIRIPHALVLGDPRDPGRLRAGWVARRDPRRCRIVVADSASVSDLRQRWQRAVGQDVAETVAWLASDAAGGTNGATLRVCGQSKLGA